MIWIMENGGVIDVYCMWRKFEEISVIVMKCGYLFLCFCKKKKVLGINGLLL